MVTKYHKDVKFLFYRKRWAFQFNFSHQAECRLLSTAPSAPWGNGFRCGSLDEAQMDANYQPYLPCPPLDKCKSDRNFLNQMAPLKSFHPIDVTCGGWFKRNWKPLIEALSAN